MKNLILNTKFSYSYVRNALGICFLLLFLIPILTHSSISQSIVELFYFLSTSITQENMVEMSWIPVSIAVLGYYPFSLMRQKAKTEKMRMKLASDLHDDLGSILHSVTIYTELALIKADPRYLNKIKEGTQEAISGIRNIMSQLDDSDRSFSNLVSRINSFASFLCEARQIDFKVSISNEISHYKLDEEEKRNLYMIIKEAINNSVKHANPAEITLCINFVKGNPVIIIKDNGTGYDPCCNVAGNGIRNMKMRATSIRYKINIHSTAGTIIQLQKK